MLGAPFHFLRLSELGVDVRNLAAGECTTHAETRESSIERAGQQLHTSIYTLQMSEHGTIWKERLGRHAST